MQGNTDALLPANTVRDIKKKINLIAPPVNSKRLTSKYLTVDATNGIISHPSRGILGPGSKQRESQKLWENKNKSELTTKTNAAYPPAGPSIKQRVNISKLNTVRSSISDALSQHGKVSPLKPTQSLHPLCKNDNDIHHIPPVVIKDVLQDRLKPGPVIKPSLRKNQYQKVSSDVELGNDKAFLKLPAATNIHSNKGKDKDKECSSKGDDKMNSRLSHSGRAPTTSINHQNQNHPTISPRCLPSAKDFKYEIDGYIVDLEIFAGNPGDKLPPLLQTFQPSVSSTLELLKLKLGQNDEPCSSSRSVYRSFADSEYPIPTEQNNEQKEIKRLDIQSIQESIVIEQENILNDSTILQQKSGVTDKSHEELSKDTIDIDTISNESLDNDVFSYGSVGGWGNYVDEDVDVGDSNNFDDEELSPSDLSATEGEFFPATPWGPNVVGSQGFMSLLPHKHILGGAYQSSGPRGEDIDLSISANTTVCLNSVGVLKLVRNLDHGIEYRNIIPGDPR